MLESEFSRKIIQRKIAFLLAGLVLGAAAFSFVIATLSLLFQPLSKAYEMQVPADAYVVHIGDAVDTGVSFRETTDQSFLLSLQKMKEGHVKYRSSDEAVATVDAGGRIVAVGEGTSKITATVSDEQKEVMITSFIPGEKIGFGKEEYRMNCGKEMSLKAVIEPLEAVLFDEIRFSSSDEKIAAVDQDGNVKALWPGDVEISVQADGLLGKTVIHVLQPMTAIDLQGSRMGRRLH